MKDKSFDEVWEGLKAEGEEARSFFQAAEDAARIINMLSAERIRRGLTQKQLAERCGMKQAAIARLEAAQSIPRLDTVIKVAEALGLRIEIGRQAVVKQVAVIDTRIASGLYSQKGSGYTYRSIKERIQSIRGAQ